MGHIHDKNIYSENYNYINNIPRYNGGFRINNNNRDFSNNNNAYINNFQTPINNYYGNYNQSNPQIENIINQQYQVNQNNYYQNKINNQNISININSNGKIKENKNSLGTKEILNNNNRPSSPNKKNIYNNNMNPKTYIQQNQYLKQNDKINNNYQNSGQTTINAQKINNINNLYSNQEIYPNLFILDEKVIPRGLENVGATCYMNATLQCFYHVKELSERIINDNLITDKLKLTFCFKGLVEELSGIKYQLVGNKKCIMKDNTNKSVKPIAFKELISEMDILFKGIKANDAKDLILFLLEKMDTELTKRNNNTDKMEMFFGTDEREINPQYFKKYHNSIVCDLFYGFQMSRIVCQGCRNTSKTFSVINFINFPLEKIYNDLNNSKKQINNNMNQQVFVDQNDYLIPNTQVNEINKNFNIESNRKLSLNDCFQMNYKAELLGDDNLMRCSNCNGLCRVIMKNDIYNAPKVLIIILNRGRGNTFQCNVDFPKILDIGKYIFNSSNSPTQTNKIYDLIGFICHLGESSMNGHFIAYCKHFDNKWYIFNDSFVTPYEINGISGTPYLLFYKSRDLK